MSAASRTPSELLLVVNARDIAGDMATIAKALNLMACQHIDLSAASNHREAGALGDGVTWAAMTIRTLSEKLATASREAGHA